jgi:hypothetical protein
MILSSRTGPRGIAPVLLVLGSLACAGPARTRARSVEDVRIRLPGREFLLSRDGIDSADQRWLPFDYEDDDQTCEVRVRPAPRTPRLELLPTSGYDVLDTLVPSAPGELAWKVRFSGLTRSEFLRLRLRDPSDSETEEILLAPTTTTRAELDTVGLELYAGQDKAIDVLVDNPGNVRIRQGWVQADGFEYRLSDSDDRIALHVLPFAVGSRDYRIPLPLRKPALVGGRPGPLQTFLEGRFQFRKAALPFVRIDPGTVLLDDRTGRDGVEVQLDADRSIATGRTYLLEEGSAPGGPAVAELYVKERLATGRALAVLRAFNVHRRGSGSLFLRDGDGARALTNLDVLPRVRVEKVQVMRNGKDWENDASVRPGETVHVRLEGQSLDQGRFGFGEVAIVPDAKDQSSDDVFECKLSIPLGISRGGIQILDHDRPTGKVLQVREVQTARAFDFVSVDHGTGIRPLPSISGPELHAGTIQDVVLRFDPSRLDSGGVLDGKQYLSVDVKVTGPSGNILDYGTFAGIVVCPEAPTPRATYYDRSDCNSAPFSLNEKLSTVNTYDLEPWSRISLVVSDAPGHDLSPQPARKIDIYRQQKTWFDVDVSFPVGLLVHRINDPGWADFSGVSMAMMAKFGWYEQGALAKKEPWEFDAGFIALDAFDLSRTATDRDLGAVGLLTLNPVDPSRKLSFPIYLGGGYLLSARSWFWLLGPGISVQL